MHTIKTRANRIAWYQDAGASSAFNPFRRSHTKAARAHGTEHGFLSHSGDKNDRGETHVETPEHKSAVLPGFITSSEVLQTHRPVTPSITRTEEHTEACVDSNALYENIELEHAITHARRSRRWKWMLLPLAPFILLVDWVSEKLSSGPTADEESNNRKSEKKHFPIEQQLRKIFLNSWVHVLLLLIPAGFAVNYLGQNAIAVFFVNFAAMAPSIMIMAMAVENILMYVGELLGGLISMTFSNAAQLITSVLLLRSHQVKVLQTSLLGAILSNLLLMPGIAFFIGGIYRTEQFFNVTTAQTTSEMLLLAVFSLMIPSASIYLTNTPRGGIVVQSQGTAFILLACYAAFMIFQLKTHRDLFTEPSQKSPKKKQRPTNVNEDEEDDNRAPELPLLTAFLVLTAFTVLLTFSTLFVTNSIQELLQSGISETFLGMILLPFISNDPTTFLLAIKDHQDLMLSLTLGRCVQIALLVIPFTILLAWMLGVKEMSLSFDGFETLIILTSVLVVNYIVQHGKSNWLVGFLLMAGYLIVALSVWFTALST